MSVSEVVLLKTNAPLSLLIFTVSAVTIAVSVPPIFISIWSSVSAVIDVSASASNITSPSFCVFSLSTLSK